jgi:hypothetical protein
MGKVEGCTWRFQFGRRDRNRDRDRCLAGVGRRWWHGRLSSRTLAGPSVLWDVLFDARCEGAEREVNPAREEHADVNQQDVVGSTAQSIANGFTLDLPRAILAQPRCQRRCLPRRQQKSSQAANQGQAYCSRRNNVIGPSAPSSSGCVTVQGNLRFLLIGSYQFWTLLSRHGIFIGKALRSMLMRCVVPNLGFGVFDTIMPLLFGGISLDEAGAGGFDVSCGTLRGGAPRAFSCPCGAPSRVLGVFSGWLGG